MTARLLSALLLFAVAAGGCDREIVEPLQPGITVLSPDLGMVLTQSKLDLRVRAEGSGQVTAVRIGGQNAERDGDAFVVSVGVSRGLTAIPLDGLNAEGEIVVTDTAYAFFALPETTTTPPSPGLAGGGAISATTLPDGRVMLAGGEPPAGESRADATIIKPIGNLLDVDQIVPLRSARYDHTATLLPDGTVLLLGGSTRRRPRTSAEFVSTAELVSLEPGRVGSQNVFINGTPPRRSGHVTRLVEADGELLLYLIGGIVPGEPPTTSPSFDVLRFIPGSAPRIAVLSPPGGAGNLPELPNPFLLDVAASPDGQALSVLYGLGPDDPVSRRLAWAPPGPANYPVGLTNTDEPAPLAVPRTGAASAALADGLFLVAGGQDDGGTILASIEAVAPLARRTFAFDASGDLRRPRTGHAATSLGPGRMLVVGGYNEGGFPILALEITTL